MRWEKKGVIFRADHQYPWMSHHACVPIAEKIADDVLRIYFGPRDRQGRTVTTFIEVEADDPSKVIRVHDRPVLALGKLASPLTRECMSAPPRLSSSLSSPVAILTSGGPPRNTFERWSIITT